MKVYTADNLDGKVRYRKQDRTRRAGIVYQYSSQEMEEHARCRYDVVYFIETYLGLKLRAYQRAWLSPYSEQRFLIFTGSRQMGRVAVLAALLLHDLIFNVNYTECIIAQKNMSIKETIGKMQILYEKLPFFLQPGLTQYEDTGFVFEHGSRIITMGSDPRSLAIGCTIDCLVMIDFAWFKTQDQIQREIIPTMAASAHSRVIIASSFNGFNTFQQLVQNGERAPGDPAKNNYYVCRDYWWQVPGRDEAWKQAQIAIIGQEAWDQEYDCVFTTKAK